MSKRRKWYVYKFLDKENDVLYVGRTYDLFKRFYNHDHLTDKVNSIQYIECNTPSEMAWKEIYYINYYYNEKLENTTDLYICEYKPVDYKFKENWIEFDRNELKIKNHDGIVIEEKILKDEYNTYVINAPKMNYKKLINILNHKKLNFERNNRNRTVYSKKWFSVNINDEKIITKIHNNLNNCIRNVFGIYSKDILWTTFDIAYDKLKGKGYTKSYISIDAPMTDKFKDRKYLAYIANNFHPSRNPNNSASDKYALTKLLQFLFRSALANGEEIHLYLPSSRMRELLTKWIEENSVEA